MPAVSYCCLLYTSRVLGENVADMDVRASAERVGYVFQYPENQIVCETVWHEMAFGLKK